MRSLCILIAAFSVAGCGKMQPLCSPTDRVRVAVDGREFSIPVDLKPSILGGAADNAALPSFLHQDSQGRRAYCQSERERPTRAETFSLYPREALPDVRFLIVGREGRTERRQPDHWPLHVEAGFEVTTTKGPTLIFSPAGGARPTPVAAHCVSSDHGVFRLCRVYFSTQGGVNVTFDIEGERGLAEWPVIISKVDSYVRALETSP